MTIPKERRAPERPQTPEKSARSNPMPAPGRDPEEVDVLPGPRERAISRGADIAAKDLAASGGFYSFEKISALLKGVSRRSIEKLVHDGRLLALLSPSKKRFYPVAQFRDDGSVVEGLRAVQDAMATRNGYAVLNFLVNPEPRLDNRKPIDLLKQGEIERVVEAAARIGVEGA